MIGLDFDISNSFLLIELLGLLVTDDDGTSLNREPYDLPTLG